MRSSSPTLGRLTSRSQWQITFPDQRGPGVGHPFVKTYHRSSVAWYAQHGRELVGCQSFGIQSPVLSSSISNGSHHTRWIAHKKTVRGEGNCGRVTDRGKEACEYMGKRRVCRLPSERHSPTRMYSHQDLPGYEQKLHLRPTTLGECAVQHEAELETERR